LIASSRPKFWIWIYRPRAGARTPREAILWRNLGSFLCWPGCVVEARKPHTSKSTPQIPSHIENLFWPALSGNCELGPFLLPLSLGGESLSRRASAWKLVPNGRGFDQVRS